MFRVFLDSDQYSFERILCTEKLFGGAGYVCPGGHEITKVCFVIININFIVNKLCYYKDLTTQLQLESGYKVLEVGSGMGRCAVYIAEVSCYHS